jgi:hypothetical protein
VPQILDIQEEPDESVVVLQILDILEELMNQ